ncbi:MAG: hypothetical protein ACI4PV_01485 [Butyricicoccus sp.]
MAKAANLPIKRYAFDLIEHLIEDDKINTLACEYQASHPDVSEAAKALIKDCSKQATCTAVMEQVTTLTKLPELAGASFGFVGLVYYQLFLVCGVAAIAGKDIHSNEVKTQCIECITVNAMARGLRAFTSKVITAILERYKLKGMEKGVDALVEFVLDWGAIKIVGNRAYKAFLK